MMLTIFSVSSLAVLMQTPILAQDLIVEIVALIFLHIRAPKLYPLPR